MSTGKAVRQEAGKAAEEAPVRASSTVAPTVSVLIPCRNEARTIEGCLHNIYSFAPPAGGFEVIVIDGMSTDGTREALTRMRQRYPGLVVIDNPHRTVPHAMNLGIRQARGEYIVRADARCIHPASYLTDLLALSHETGADNVGGVLVPAAGDGYVQQSIATAYKSPIAMGGALRERSDFAGETDTVYGGCFRRSRLIEIGMYDEEMVRNQDDELSFRLRKMGGTIIQHGKIRVRYFPRSRYSQLFKQFLQYGYWKVTVIRKHPNQASFRHLLPALLVAGLALLAAAAPLHRYAFAAWAALATSYALAVGIEAFRLTVRDSVNYWPGTTIAIMVIHVGFGVGFLAGVVCKALNIKPRYFETLSR
jgi:GT2 family glycosyltransferase